jgi:5,10-methenyltetrahydromethanopterin hydrogenase
MTRSTTTGREIVSSTVGGRGGGRGSRGAHVTLENANVVVVVVVASAVLREFVILIDKFREDQMMGAFLSGLPAAWPPNSRTRRRTTTTTMPLAAREL